MLAPKRVLAPSRLGPGAFFPVSGLRGLPFPVPRYLHPSLTRILHLRGGWHVHPVLGGHANCHHAWPRKTAWPCHPTMLCLLKRVQEKPESELIIAQELIEMAQNPVTVGASQDPRCLLPAVSPFIPRSATVGASQDPRCLLPAVSPFIPPFDITQGGPSMVEGPRSEFRVPRCLTGLRRGTCRGRERDRDLPVAARKA